MANFIPVIRNQRRNGLYQVYIRITHNRKVAYLKTDKLVAADGVHGGHIVDSFVNRYCYELIDKYSKWLNGINARRMSAPEVRCFLLAKSEGRSFTDFFNHFMEHTSGHGEGNNAMVYQAAYKSFERFVAGPPVEFSHFTKGVLLRWIASLEGTRRARSLYPACLRRLFRLSQDYATDPASGFERMEVNPWAGIEIPRYAKAVKRAVTAELCRSFFAAAIPEGCRWGKRAALGRDVAMMVLCLAGINTVDLYKLRRGDLCDGVLCYRRSKTEGRRDDGAYFEIRVPELLRPVMERYLSRKEGSDRLFCFAELYPSAKIFNISVNGGIKRLCIESGISAGKPFSVYTFRHTWATVAQNECGATIEEVGFAMNHSHGTGVTRGYIKIDFSPAWRLNERVVDFVFNSDRRSRLSRGCGDSAPVATVEEGLPGLVRAGDLLYGGAYCHGRLLAEVCDIGFESVDAVIACMVGKLPDSIPEGEVVHFRIKNLDSGGAAVYERMKGKGF